MEMNTKGITVYCASSRLVDSVYTDAARELGTLAAAAGVPVICGAGRTGLMGALIDGAIDNGGKAIGVIPRFMVDNGWNHTRVTETIVTDDMHQRKQTMAALARGVIAMPGGCGTFEELLEIITWRQLGLYQGRIVILNTAGYYDPLLEMFRRSIDLHFMNPDHADLWLTATTPAEALELALGHDEPRTFSQKIGNSDSSTTC